MSSLCVALASADPATSAPGEVTFPVMAALVWVLLPALLVTVTLGVALRALRRRNPIPSWRLGLATVGALALGAAAAVPGSVSLFVRTVTEWVDSGDEDARRTTVGGLLLLPAWWLYTDGGRDDRALLRLEGPDGALKLDPLVEPTFSDGVSQRLDGATVQMAIDRALSPSGAERRDALPRALRGIATRLVALEADALAESYDGLLTAVSAVSAPRGLSASADASATWFLETHLPRRAWTLGGVAIAAMVAVALLLCLPLLLAVLRRSPSRE
jgi:hypothetical protein